MNPAIYPLGENARQSPHTPAAIGLPKPRPIVSTRFTESIQIHNLQGVLTERQIVRGNR